MADTSLAAIRIKATGFDPEKEVVPDHTELEARWKRQPLVVPEPVVVPVDPNVVKNLTAIRLQLADVPRQQIQPVTKVESVLETAPPKKKRDNKKPLIEYRESSFISDMLQSDKD